MAKKPRKTKAGAGDEPQPFPTFEFKECSSLISPTGQKAANLAQLAFAIRRVNPNVIYHHVYRCFLNHTYQSSAFPNDFAIWSAQALDDFVLAEKLAGLDPYEEKMGIEQVRENIATMVEDRLAESSYVPVAKPGYDFFFESSVLHVVNSGLTAINLTEFAENLRLVHVSSVYYHFYDARKRLGKNIDDISQWLLNDKNRYEKVIKRIGEIDFYLIDLEELRNQLIGVLQEALHD